MRIEIELPEAFQIKRSKATVTVNVRDFDASMWSRLAMHGAIQKIGDCAAGAADKDASDEEKAKAGLPAMEAMIAQLADGNWGKERGTNADEPDWYRFMRAIVRRKLSAAGEAEYKALEAKDRNDFLNKRFLAASEAAQAAVQKQAELDLKAHNKKLAEAKALDAEF